MLRLSLDDAMEGLWILWETGGVMSPSATRLGVPRTILNAMMRKLGISARIFDDADQRA
jgi:hypothetical protein